MGALPQPVIVSFEEFLAGINDKDLYARCEYWDGEIIEKAMPAEQHADVQIQLGSELVMYFRANPIGRAYTELHCVFLPGRRALVPDLSVVLGARQPGGEALQRAPDLAVEILSPDDRASRVARKIEQYVTGGVKIVWVIDPEIRRAWVYKPNEPVRAVGIDGKLTGDDLLPGLEIALANLFPAS